MSNIAIFTKIGIDSIIQSNRRIIILINSTISFPHNFKMNSYVRNI